MGTLDPRFVVTSDLEAYFVDKDTGLPLAAGIVTFYSDPNFNFKKPVYQLTVNGTNFDYTPLPNPSILSSVGTFQDALGNNIVPYYFPFEGTPDASDGTVELYYITVENSGNIEQFTRSAWPNFTEEEVPEQNELVNFIANGQFIVHNNLPANTQTSTPAGKITARSTQIAQGGWSIEVPTNPINGDYRVTFVQLNPAANVFGDYPRYLIDINVLTFNGDPYIALRETWANVNQFNSKSSANTYTITLQAKALAGTHVVNVVYIKNFGTGGTPAPFETPIGSFNVTSVNQPIFIPNVYFGDNTGSTVGPLNDDFLAIEFRIFGAPGEFQFTDFAVIAGNVNQSTFVFPETTNGQMIVDSLNGYLPVPSYDGNDFFLPIVVNKTGTQVDRSSLGMVVAKLQPPVVPAITNELLCDGQQLRRDAYSTLGIPYNRLFSEVLYDATAKIAKFGNGATYCNAYINTGNPAQIILCNNNTTAGSNSQPANGVPTPGFTYGAPLVTAPPPILNAHLVQAASNTNYIAHSNATGLVTAVATITGATFGSIGAADGNPATGIGAGIISLKNPAETFGYYAFTVQAPAASTLTNTGNPGKCFTFRSTTTPFYVWFKFTNETDPTATNAGGTGIQVNLTTQMTALEVGIIIANAISGYQVDLITCMAATAFTGGENFTFDPNNNVRTCWYTVNGLGTPIVNPEAFKVALLTSDTAIQVADKTRVGINNQYYALPDLRGMFLRGVDPDAQWDIDVLKRWGFNGELSGAVSGSFEIDQIISHNHTLTPALNYLQSTAPLNQSQGAGEARFVNPVIDFTGGSETRPVNMSVYWTIKY